VGYEEERDKTQVIRSGSVKGFSFDGTPHLFPFSVEVTSAAKFPRFLIRIPV